MQEEFELGSPILKRLASFFPRVKYFLDIYSSMKTWHWSSGRKKVELHKMGNVSSGVNLGFLRCFAIYRAEIKFPTSSLGPWLMSPIGRYRVSLEQPHRKFFRRFWPFKRFIIFIKIRRSLAIRIRMIMRILDQIRQH